jgi:molybdate transport system substrate-binding protein
MGSSLLEDNKSKKLSTERAEFLRGIRASLRLFVLSCFSVGLSSSPAQPPTLLVAAASDLAPVSQQLAAAYEAEAGVKIVWTFGASGKLQRQVEAGAPFSVFLSADPAALGRIQRPVVGRKVAFVLAPLGFWLRSCESNGGIPKLEHLSDQRIRYIAMANPAYAPFGVAARKLLIERGLYTPLKRKIVLADTARAAWQMGESGNADAVLTSWSMMHGRPCTARLPLEIEVAAVVLKDANSLRAQHFVAWLRQATAQSHFFSHGYHPHPDK